MRTVVKGVESKELRDWKRSNATSPQNRHYDHLSGAVKKAMLEKLAAEQGWLCAYTMKQIMDKEGGLQAHIEHILPRSAHPDQSLEWQNLIACVPQPGVSCEYGAKLKDAYDPATQPFVNPTMGGVSAQFRFRENGEVDGLTDAARITASQEVLHLNHPNLTNDRKGKIQGAIAHRPTAAQARQRAQLLRKTDQNGMLEPYCEAVAQVLESYATRLEKRAARLSGTRSVSK